MRASGLGATGSSWAISRFPLSLSLAGLASSSLFSCVGISIRCAVMHSLERSTSEPAAHESCDRPHSSPTTTPPFVALDAAPRPPAPAPAPTCPPLLIKLTHARTTRLLAHPSPSSPSPGAEPDHSFPTLCAAAHALFGLAPSQSVRALLYDDEGEEGGVVTLSSTGELWALLALVRAGAGAGGARAVRLRLVVEEEEEGQEEEERERREAARAGWEEEVDGAPEAARAAFDAPDAPDDDVVDGAAAALSRAPSTRGRGMGSLRGVPAPPSSASSASERGASLGRSLVRRLSRRFSRRSLRGEGGALSFCFLADSLEGADALHAQRTPLYRRRRPSRTSRRPPPPRRPPAAARPPAHRCTPAPRPRRSSPPPSPRRPTRTRTRSASASRSPRSPTFSRPTGTSRPSRPRRPPPPLGRPAARPRRTETQTPRRRATAAS